MKKRTKFRLRNDLAAQFRISIFLCFLGALTSYYLFHTSFFKALSKLGEEPIATITFKYKTAERKFLERVVWDRLRQNSPVYNGDTIHTAELSEATVWFTDGTALELAENTMAQVFLHSDGTLLADLGEGTATVDSSESGNGLTLTAANVQLNVKKGTKISATKSDSSEDISLTVQKGQASLSNGKDFLPGDSFAVDSSGQTKELLSVTKPLPVEKFLYHSDGMCPVDFEWKNAGNSSSVQLKIASDKNFSNVVQSHDVTNLSNVSLNLPKGLYYWSLSSGDGKKQAENRQGKFQIIQSLKPSLIVPAQEYTYTYRKVPPSVRFIWSESEASTAYNFAVSKNPDMSNPVINQRSSSSSLIISTLQEGTYYYQVTPYYVLNRQGLSNPSDIGSFKIERLSEMTAPLLLSPGDKEFLDKTKKSANLSWKMEDEPVTYRVLVSSRADLSSPVISKETNENFISLSSSELKSLKDGEYFWAVSQSDSEGNVSEFSKIRSFYAINGEIEQRSVFPPDGYEIWSPLLSDMRFTWKTNLSFTHYIQVARDKDFNDIVFDSEASGQAFSGLRLPEGQYYWRLTTKDDNFKRATAGKKLFVVPEFLPPKISYPTLAKKAVVRPSEACNFAWDKEEEADYYRVKIYKNESNKPFYDENFISDNNIDLNVENLEEGSYRWEIQAYSYETETSSRRSSLLSDSRFILRKIRPATLSSPENGAKIDGWEAIENPPLLKWASGESYSSAQIVLVKKTGPEAGEKVFNQTGHSQKLPPLSSGTYEWTVKALSYDELDISSMEKFTFTVEELPPFPAPEDAETDGTDLFNASYLKKKPYILFKWKSVPRCEDYILEILGKKNEVLFRQIISGNENTSFKFEDLKKLDKGNFTWRVKAVLMTEDKKEILIDGNTSENKFTIDYTLKANGGKRKNRGALYAQ